MKIDFLAATNPPDLTDFYDILYGYPPGWFYGKERVADNGPEFSNHDN
jgi:hypothetical protein